MAGSCEQSNEPSLSIQCEFLEYLLKNSSPLFNLSSVYILLCFGFTFIHICMFVELVAVTNL